MTFEIDRSGDGPRTGAVRPKSDGLCKSVGQSLMTALVVVALLGAPTVGFAASAAEVTGREGGLGAAAALSTLVYGPVKLLYATGGLIVGGFAWAFTAGDTQVAEKVLTRSVRGTYVITPDHLTGEQELVFIGRDVGAPAMRTEAVASAETAESEPIDTSGNDELGW